MTSEKSDQQEQAFGDLLNYLRQERGFDLTGYKPTSLKRRVLKQMQTHHLQDFSEYLDYLQVHPEEFPLLFNTILINVTAFFRDHEAWSCLQKEVLPQLIAAKPEQSPIRLWSAGCASGEEAYTLAIILTEILGAAAFRQRVKIYATDVDEEALEQARHMSYRAQDLKSIPEELRERYFDAGGQYADLRRSVIFGRHDLVQDAPISRLDLLVCRNTLIYLNAETQTKILRRFHFALNDTGVLFLGKAEMLLSHANLFMPISLTHRIFRRVSRSNGREFLLALPQAVEPTTNTLESSLRLQELGFNAFPLAHLIIDFSGKLVLANTLSRAMFSITTMDLGRPLQDLEISYRPLELRSRIEQVYQEHRLVVIQNVVWQVPDKSRQYVDIQITPLEADNGEILGVSVSFINVSRAHELQEELQHANQQLETANEKLQSTNEELETINEELQSTNEELQTINDEVQQRTNDLNQSNSFLNSILACLKAGVIVIDNDYKVLSWNSEAENLWGLRTEEVQGQSLWALDIGLPIEQLREPLRQCLIGAADRQESMISATNRRGQSIRCRLTYNPLRGHERDIQGVIILMEETEP